MKVSNRSLKLLIISLGVICTFWITSKTLAAIVPGCRDDRGWSGSCVQQTPYLDKTTVAADGTDKAKFWIKQSFSNSPDCFYEMYLIGDGTISKTKLFDLGDGTYESAYVSSNTIGDVFVRFHKACMENTPENYRYYITLTTPIKFVDPSTIQNDAVAPTPAPAVEDPIPVAPVLDTVKVGVKEVTPDKITDTKINTKKKLKFFGKTIPNATVTLYFHSDPFEASTTSDAEGNWTYELEKGKLGVGEHNLQIAVTDPVTGKTSEKSEATSFTIDEAPKLVTSSEKVEEETLFSKAYKNDYYPWMVAGVFFIVVVGGAVTYTIVRFRMTEGKNMKNSSKSTKK